MKKLTVLICIIISSLALNAQLIGDFGVWAKTPIALKKSKIQFEYNASLLNFKNVPSVYYRDSGKIKDSVPSDYKGYSYLGFNLRYGLTDKLEVATSISHVHYPKYVSDVFNKNNFNLMTVQLKYQLNKEYKLRSKLTVVGGARFDVFNNTDYTDIFDTTFIYEYPFTNFYHIGFRGETKLHENLLLRYNALIFWDYTKPKFQSTSPFRAGPWFRNEKLNINLQYFFNKKIGAFTEYSTYTIDDGGYQFGAYYNFNSNTQLTGIYNRDIMFSNLINREHPNQDIFKLAFYKAF